jgi:integrase
VSRNVAKLTDPPRVPRRPVRPLEPHEIRRFLEAIAGDRVEALYIAAIGTGLRQGELLGLGWPDVDLEADTITVRHALQRVEGRLVLVEPKSATSHRTIAMPSFVVQALRAHRVRQHEARLPPAPGGSTTNGLSCSAPPSARRSTASPSPGACRSC